MLSPDLAVEAEREVQHGGGLFRLPAGEELAGGLESCIGLIGPGVGLGVDPGRSCRAAGQVTVPELGEVDRQVDAKIGVQHSPLEAGQELVDQVAHLHMPVGGEQNPG